MIFKRLLQPMPRLPFAAAAVAVLVGTGSVFGDVIWVGGSSGRGLRQDVNIQGADGDALLYLLNGNRASTPFERIQQIEYDDEPTFTRGEAAFAAGQWSDAAQAYERVANQASADDWVKRRAARRLVEAAAAAGAFDQSVSGFLALLTIDPASATSAMPALDENVTDNQLDSASQAVNAALNGSAGSGNVRQKVLLAFLLGVEVRRGNTQAAQAVIERLDAVMPAQPTDDPADRQLFAEVTLAKARRALASNRASEVEPLLRERGGVFEQPATQSDALFLIAQAAQAQAEAAGGKREDRLDAALAYLKVAALFKGERGRPNVAESLFRAGQIHESLNLTEDARSLYLSVAEDYPDSGAAAKAQARLDAMPAANPQAGEASESSK